MDFIGFSEERKKKKEREKVDNGNVTMQADGSAGEFI